MSTGNQNAIETNTHVCPHQFAFFLDNWLRRLIQSPNKIVGPYIKKGNTVIDMGCGPGYFSIDMAKMVGPSGKVIAIDIQPRMLSRVERKAKKHAVSERIHLHLAQSDQIGSVLQADFILAYYMIHETPDMGKALQELKDLLKSEGKILVVEPKMHVNRKKFEMMLQSADNVGLKTIEFPKGKGGRAVLLSHKP